MPRRPMMNKREHKIEVHLNELEKEWLARISYDRNLSMSEFFRRGCLPSPEIMQRSVEALRNTQKKIQGVVLNGRK